MNELEQLLLGRQVTAQEINTPADVLAKIPKLIKRPAIIRQGNHVLCQRCGSRLMPKQVLLPNGSYYCPKCLMLGRLTSTQSLYSIKEVNAFGKYQQNPLTWQGKLSPYQQRVAQKLIVFSQQSGDHLLWAVTGAGKTEMTFYMLADALKKQKRVCFAAPRIDVIGELLPRMQAAFATTPIACLTGKSPEKYRYTQFVLCTTHQLLRFYHAFDLMIIDEVDAFPFLGNKMLSYASLKALKQGGSRLLMTATPDSTLLKAFKAKTDRSEYLPLRFHQHPLPVPKIICRKHLREDLRQHKLSPVFKNKLQDFVKEGYPFLIFVPKIALLKPLEKLIKQVIPASCAGTTVYANDAERLTKVKALREEKLTFLITTTILERGVTFPKLNVLIFLADDVNFNMPALVQIAGRVGRSSQRPDGQVIFLCEHLTCKVKKAKQQIMLLNRKAKKMKKDE